MTRHTRGTVRALAALLVLAATLVGALTLDPAGAAPRQPGTDRVAVNRIPTETYERRVRTLINRRRQHHGLRPVHLGRCADHSADRWADHLAATGQLVHQDLAPFFHRCSASYAGETLAKGAVRPEAIVEMWMHSPGHRHILLSRSPRLVGVGAALDHGAWVVAADFIRH